MSSPEAGADSRAETQGEETQAIDKTDSQETSEEIGNAQPTTKPRKERVRNQGVDSVREQGKSLFPISKVQKIIKADKDIPIVAKDATFLISIATEEFIKRITEAGKQVAEREKRATVQYKDIATVVRKVDEFLFLEEIIPWVQPGPSTKRSGKEKEQPRDEKAAPTLLDRFVVGGKRTERDEDIDDQGDIVMNEDGTMAAGVGMDDDFD